MNIKVSWAGEALFIGESTTGHKLLMDGPPEGGGHDLGPRPMEMLLLGTGSCSCYDVIHILKKSRQDVIKCEVENGIYDVYNCPIRGEDEIYEGKTYPQYSSNVLVIKKGIKSFLEK